MTYESDVIDKIIKNRKKYANYLLKKRKNKPFKS